MSDPKRIWLQPSCCYDDSVGRCWADDNPFEHDCNDDKRQAPTEYVRADLYAELEDQIADLLDKKCSTCGQDERIAEIGKRLGFRPDVGALIIHKLETENKRLREQLRNGIDTEWIEGGAHE